MGSAGPAPGWRMRQVLDGIAAGLGDEQIAARLGLSLHTVRDYRKDLYAELGVSTQGQAVAAGFARGWLTLPAGVVAVPEDALAGLVEVAEAVAAGRRQTGLLHARRALDALARAVPPSRRPGRGLPAPRVARAPEPAPDVPVPAGPAPLPEPARPASVMPCRRVGHVRAQRLAITAR